MSQNEKSNSVSLLKLRKSPSVSSRDDGVPAVWDIGDVILDLYEVKDVFWPGAASLVYRVHHREWNIDLAVKSPRETPFETEQQTENFVRGADAWVGLGLFPYVVSCYYVRKLGGIPRLFLEFVEGGSLHDWIHTRRLYEGGAEESLKRILDISIQFAWGLQYAHSQGLIHQDVRPSNLLLTSDGCAKVKGFGLAHARASSTNPITKENSDRGATELTSAYGAPEQAGEQGLSWQADIWSWAVSVLEMFAGESQPREEELTDVALENYLERGTQGGDIPQMPAAVADLLRQCFQSEPSQRPSGMGEVANALREIYRQETGSAHPRQLPIQPNTRAEALNNRALSLLDLGKTDEAIRLWDEALIVKPQYVEATYNRGLALWRAGRLADDALVRMLEGLKNSEQDDEFINYLLSLVHLERDDGKAATEALGDNENADADQSDVSEEITSQNRGLQSERPLTAFLDDEICGPNLFSPDGKNLLLTVSGFRIRILDFNAPLSPRYLRGHTKDINAITINADGRYALTSSEDGTVRLWDVLAAKCLQTIKDDGWPHPNLLALSADGRYGALRFDPWLTEKASLQLWDVRAGRHIRNFETAISEYGELQFICAVSISPDGKYVLTGGNYGTVQLWNLSTGKSIRELAGLSGYVKFVGFSPDGRRCFAANDCEVREFDVRTGTCLETATVDEPDDSKSSFITISADGIYALFGSSYGELKLWEISTARCVRTFQDLTKKIRHDSGSYERITSINLSADGKYSLSGTRGGSYTLWRFNPEYHAPMILSRVVATEEALDNQVAAEEYFALARKALAEHRFVDAANHVRAARALSGFERSAEAVELWTSLYLHLPHTRLTASWHSHELKGQELPSSISINADGKYVLFGGFDMELREAATGKCLRVFDKAMRGNAALSGDARLAMIGGWESYELWDTGSGNLINKIYSCHEKHVKDIQLSVDGKFGASCTEEALNLWEITDEGLGYLPSTKTNWGELSAVAISSDNKYCVTGTGFSSSRDDDYTLKLWEIPSGQCVRTFEGYDGGTYTIVFSPDNKHFLGAGYDGKLRLWEVATGKCLQVFEGHTQPVDSVDISADGKYALSGGRDHTMRLWEMASGQCLRTWEINAQFISPVRFTADGKYILFGSGDATIRAEALDWELEDRELSDWDEGARPFLQAFVTRHAAAFGKKVPAWSEDDFEALLYQLGCAGYGWLQPEGVRRELEKLATEIAPTVRLLLSPERFNRTIDAGRGLLSDEKNNPTFESVVPTIDLWTKEYLEAASQESVRAVVENAGSYTRANWSHSVSFEGVREQPTTFSRNQEVVASCFQETLKLWSSRAGESLHDLSASGKRLECASFSYDGRLVATGAVKDSISVWDLAAGICIATLADKNTRREAISFSPDGKLLASGDWDGTVKVWSIEMCEMVRVLKGHEDTITAIDFSPTGELIAAGGWDRTVKLWNLETGDCVRTLPGHSGSVGIVCFSPDGLLIATSSRDKFGDQDKLITLWDTKTGEVVRSFEGHDGRVLSFAFSPQGPFLVSASDDGSVRLWDVRTAECICVMDATLGDESRSNARYAQRVNFTLDGQNVLFCRGQSTWIERAGWSLDWGSERDDSTE